MVLGLMQSVNPRRRLQFQQYTAVAHHEIRAIFANLLVLIKQAEDRLTLKSYSRRFHRIGQRGFIHTLLMPASQFIVNVKGKPPQLGRSILHVVARSLSQPRDYNG